MRALVWSFNYVRVFLSLLERKPADVRMPEIQRLIKDTFSKPRYTCFATGMAPHCRRAHLWPTGPHALSQPAVGVPHACGRIVFHPAPPSVEDLGISLITPHALAAADALPPEGQRRRSGFARGERQGRRRGRTRGRSVGVDGRQAGGGGCGALRTARGPLAVDRRDQRGAAVVPVQPGVPGGKRLLELILEVINACFACEVSLVFRQSAEFSP